MRLVKLLLALTLGFAVSLMAAPTVESLPLCVRYYCPIYPDGCSCQWVECPAGSGSFVCGVPRTGASLSVVATGASSCDAGNSTPVSR
jgi:hypothetical protein